MDVKRLRTVGDLCPIPGNGFWCPSGTRWQGSVAPTIAPIIWREDGYTATVMQSPLFTWLRTFTSGNTPPQNLHEPRSLITLYEWIPTSRPQQYTGWKHVGASDLAAVTLLQDDYQTHWSGQARRHLRIFERSNLTLELGTLDEVDAIYRHSQVPRSMQAVFRNVVKRHLAIQPETVDMLIARAPDGTPCAAFIAGNCEEIKQSTYLVGCFHPAYAKHSPMFGLVDWWFRRSIERGYISVNFGDIVPPRPMPSFLERGIGYSLFKTHFDIHRVWLPGSYWKLKV